MITATSLTNGTLQVVLDNGKQIISVRNDDARWKDAIAALNAKNEARLLEVLSLKAVVEEYSNGDLSINATGVIYNGQPLHTVDANRVMAFMREGLPYQPIANYIARKLKNPSARAITEMYAFLEHGNMPLTPNGFIIAYKGVSDDFYSKYGNKETVVIQGTVNEKGQILNRIGDTIEVLRSSVDDDFRRGCSFGLHAGSLTYAKGWGSRVVLVQIDPADVVSIPEDCSCQKLRCCKYTVIGEYTGPMPDTYTSEFTPDNEEAPEDTAERESEGEQCGDGCQGCGTCHSVDPNITTDAPPVDSVKKDIEIPGWSEFGFVEDAVSNRLRLLLAEQLGVDEDLIKPATTLPELGADSLDGVEIVMAIEEEWQFEIMDEEAEKAEGYTFAQMVDAIRLKLGVKPPIVSPGVSTTVVDNSTVAQAAVEAGVIEDDDHEEHYLKGLQQGIADKGDGKFPQYLQGDQSGAESPAHEAQIEGYLNGYAS